MITVSGIIFLYITTYIICSLNGNYGIEIGRTYKENIIIGPDSKPVIQISHSHNMQWVPKWFPPDTDSFIWYFYLPAVHVDMEFFHKNTL